MKEHRVHKVQFWCRFFSDDCQFQPFAKSNDFERTRSTFSFCSGSGMRSLLLWIPLCPTTKPVSSLASRRNTIFWLKRSNGYRIVVIICLPWFGDWYLINFDDIYIYTHIADNLNTGWERNERVQTRSGLVFNARDELSQDIQCLVCACKKSREISDHTPRVSLYLIKKTTTK